MEDTIVAIATAFGEGSIGIIRISGEKSKDILDDIFVSKNTIQNRKLTYGHIVDKSKVIDEVMAVYMRAPSTYTREDVVEIHCHGSIVSLKKIMELIIEKGARAAERGEFTKRAFLNGRLDLAQAEAVIDLINAKNNKSFDIAISQLDGQLSKSLNEISSQIMEILVSIAVNIDYPDEDIEEVVYEQLEKDILNIQEKIKDMADSFKEGKIIKEGIKTAIIGKPNVGKSSLLNKLLKRERAIVTDIEGTTRDIIEEEISIDGISLILVDTAGIRDTADKIEQIGIEKSKASFNEADIIIFVIDMSRPITKEDLEIAENIADRKAIVLLNKTDLDIVADVTEIKNLVVNGVYIETSTETVQGIDDIKKTIIENIHLGEYRQEKSNIITNSRHYEKLISSYSSLNDAIMLVKNRDALDFIELDIRNAYDNIGEITGNVASADVIDEVFKRFCLGK